MFGIWSSKRILLFTGETDLRKGYDGLSALVTAAGENVYSGDVFVFVSSRRTAAKILLQQTGGMMIVQKRLDRGRFKVAVSKGGERAELDATQLAMLLDGIDFARVRRPKHWQPGEPKK